MWKLRSRYRAWMLRRRAAGATVSSVLSRELPGKLARKGSDSALQALNRLYGRARGKAYAARVAQVLAAAPTDPFVVVVVPWILHYVVPCLELATRHVPVVIVLNGLREEERQWLEQRFPRLPTVRLQPLPGSMLAHGSVMKILLRAAPRSFGLLDPDLFVFTPEVFDDLTLRHGEIAAGAYGFTNKKTGLTFPTTHLLALRVAVVQDLMQRYHVGPEIYTRTPGHLVGPLRSVGFGDHNYVKEYLPYYDPLNLIMALAAYERMSFRVLDRGDRDVFHVGGVSYMARNRVIDYFNLRLLALPFARPFAERYRRHLLGGASAEVVPTRRVEGIDPHVLDRIESTLDRIASEVGD